MIMDKIFVTTKEEIDALGSALTIEGLAEDSIPDFLDWIKEKTKLNNEKVYIIKGKVMNEIYNLTGDNAYPDDCTIVSVDLNDMENWSAVVMPRFQIGARWLDDIIDNNVRREEEDY